MKKIVLLAIMLLLVRYNCISQSTFPVNGIPDERFIYYAFVNATVFTDYQTKIDSATLLIKNGKVEAVGKNVIIPAGAVTYDLSGRFIYPSFIDAWTDYGMPEIAKGERSKVPQLATKTKGAYAWNQALKPETDAAKVFTVNNDVASKFRKAGFGIAFTSYQDGIARGTGAVVCLGEGKEQELIIKARAAACYSFKKGTSEQDYPTSQMGAIALLRQTYMDAAWYRNGGREKEFNISLQEWNNNQQMPQIFEAEDKFQSIRADKIADEAGVKYIIRGSGDEYQQLEEIAKTSNSYILPLRFPEAFDVADPYDAMNITLADLKHWEMAPFNASLLQKANVTFAFTASGLKDPSDFIQQLRKVVKYGLTEENALKAATYTPSVMLGISDKTGMLKKGMLADFNIWSANLFNKDAILLENWIQGKKYLIKQNTANDIRGNYRLAALPNDSLLLRIGGETFDFKATIIDRNDTLKASITFSNNIITLRYEIKKNPGKGTYVLNGYRVNDRFNGTGEDPDFNTFPWSATFLNQYIPEVKKDTAPKEVPVLSDVYFPNKAFGFNVLPVKETVVIKNVTVWTNEKEGILDSADVLISDGKISKIGKRISAAGAIVIDGAGKHLTSGIIDEHSHIAISGDVNECSHSVTSEVRIGDVINSEDINIYRQLSGGVTTSQLLHGSCNPIGGQSAIIKLRWGLAPEKLKFEGADQFIKFALGENVKQSNWGDEVRLRYPQTRMGIEQVYYNAFTRAKEYEAMRKNSDGKKSTTLFRRDLRLEALVEILNKRRFITCHSYQQGEINMLMHVGDSMGFKVNTFTHVLEGYKVADKLKNHGAGASTFSDWWAYKFEVIEAIPYNGSILHDEGVVTAYNSDDAEMARRLNQEAAKAVKYGGVSEEEALKFVTLNPAKLLHIDNRVGSIREGKDADVVLWSENPLSVYAKVLKTYIDGVCYYDSERDLKLQQETKKERSRLIEKMMAEKNKPGSSELKKPPFKKEILHHCIDEE
jgi:imidazolonepropionase-like amidohydrolase